MIDHRYKPSHLPQMNAPFRHVLNALKEEGIKYLIQDVNPKKLKPMQGIVSLDKISEMDANSLKPYWISEDDCVLDGHHRHGKALSAGLPKTKVVKIKLPARDAIRVLNKIQDIYDYMETQKKMGVDESGLSQNVLNDTEDRDYTTYMDEIISVEPDQEILHSDYEVVDNKSNKKTIDGYRAKELKEESNSGNFFSVKPIDGYIRYNMEFDNLLDTNDFGMTFSGEDAPTKKLAMVWFPNKDFSKIAKNIGADETKLINRVVSEKARRMGYDGIKYGDIIIQGL